MKKKILLVDDDKGINNLISQYLTKEGYEVYTAEDGPAGLKSFESLRPDLLVLDIMLPGFDGLELLSRIRQRSDVYVIMLTAKSDETDKIVGLTVGADDYITKPFSVREVLARVKAQLRRVSLADIDLADHQKIMVFGDLEIDHEAYQVRRGGEVIELTLREFELVRFLAQNAGQVFSREALLEKVWGYEYFGDVRTVDVTVRRTREKLEPDQHNYRYILTKRGVGYYFDKNPAS